MYERLRTPRYWIFQACLAACWIGVWHLGRVLEHTGHASLWFPPAALTFALFLAEHELAIPAVLAGSLVTTFQSAALRGDPRSALEVLLSGLAFAAAHIVAYGFAALVYDRASRGERLGSPRSVAAFLAVATFSSLLAAVGGLAALMVTGESVPGGLTGNLVPWWIGDLVAVVTLAPLLLAGVDRFALALRLPSTGWAASLRRLGPVGVPLGGFLLKLAVSLAVVAVFGMLAARGDLGVPVALVVYVVIVPLMWVSHTEGGLRTVVAVAVLATAVVAVTRMLGLVEQAFNYQAAMIAIAGTGLYNLAVPRLYADNRRLLTLLTFDRLTGARTRQAFLEAAEDMLSRHRRDDTRFVLVMFDVDHFKSINDTFGHAAGDTALSRVGEVCRSELRGVDLFGRLGGEEFAVLVPFTGDEPPLGVGERLRHAIARTSWMSPLDRATVTASFGVILVAPDEPLARALDRADRALYEAKRGGRDQVRVADESSPAAAVNAPVGLLS